MIAPIRGLDVFAKPSTPTRVIGVKLGRTPASIQKQAALEGISRNKQPPSDQKGSRAARPRRESGHLSKSTALAAVLTTLATAGTTALAAFAAALATALVWFSLARISLPRTTLTRIALAWIALARIALAWIALAGIALAWIALAWIALAWIALARIALASTTGIITHNVPFSSGGAARERRDKTQQQTTCGIVPTAEKIIRV
jgi:hypothetical protein